MRDQEVIAVHVLRSGVNYKLAVQKLRDEIVSKAGISLTDITGTTATGQGASMVEFADQQVADIRCCARAMNNIFPEVRTVIDVEGQSTQVLLINEQGQIVNFVTSERCASGAGRFLDIIANVLQIPL